MLPYTSIPHMDFKRLAARWCTREMKRTFHTIKWFFFFFPLLPTSVWWLKETRWWYTLCETRRWLAKRRRRRMQRQMAREPPRVHTPAQGELPFHSRSPLPFHTGNKSRGRFLTSARSEIARCCSESRKIKGLRVNIEKVFRCCRQFLAASYLWRLIFC